MNKTYQYKLDPGSKKIVCPNCGQKKLTRYMDSYSNEFLPLPYGRCDREVNCSYHVNPYREGYQRPTEVAPGTINIVNHPETRPIQVPYYIPREVLYSTLQPADYTKNAFIQNLLKTVPYPFDAKDIEAVTALYYLGTIQGNVGDWYSTYPFIDITGNVRAIQAKQFDGNNHTTSTNFVHSLIARDSKIIGTDQPDWLIKYRQNELKVSCLFGEHLLQKYPVNPIALVEAPKTAVYGTLYLGFPDNPKNLIWLGVYNLSSLTFEKCKILKGRDVFLFPDLSTDGKAYQLWSNKSKEFSERLPGTRFIVSDFLESIAPNNMRERGADLADVLIQMDWRLFRTSTVNRSSIKTFSYQQSAAFDSEKSEKGASPEKTFLLENKDYLKVQDSEKNERSEMLAEIPEATKAPQKAEVVGFDADKNVAFIREPYRGIDFVYTCPSCKSLKMFVRYIEPETGNYFGDNIGRCNMETLCGYDLKPIHHAKN